MEQPTQNGFFIYSKTDCKYCVDVKQMLDELFIFYKEVKCEFLDDAEKAEFLEFIKTKNGGKPWKSFPMVFHDGDFVGGYKETGILLEKINAFNF